MQRFAEKFESHIFIIDSFSGQKIELLFPGYNMIPVDLNGDGVHELASALGEQSDRNIYNIEGNVLGSLGARALISMASKFIDLPGEQIMAYFHDGRIKIFADKNARDSGAAQKQYQHLYYHANHKLTAQGYNLVNLGGL